MSGAGHETQVWDASAMLHAATIDRLDVLVDLAIRSAPADVRVVTTAAVDQELRRLGADPRTSVEVVHVDGLDEVVALGRWLRVMSSDVHHRGEATVCAWAEIHGGLVVMDDGDARRAARRQGLRVTGSLGLIARAVRADRITLTSAGRLVDDLLDAGARYPCARGRFAVWAEGENLLRS